jgi:hypothetical protein
MPKIDLKRILDCLSTLSTCNGKEDEESQAEFAAASKTLTRLLTGFGDNAVMFLQDKEAEVMLDTLRDKVAMMVSKDNRDIVIKIEPEIARGFASALVMMADYAEAFEGESPKLFRKNKILGMSQFPSPMQIEDYFPLNPNEAKALIDVLGECDLKERLEDFLEFDGWEDDDDDEYDGEDDDDGEDD